MNRTRGQFLTSAIAVGALGVITLVIGFVGNATGRDFSRVVDLGILFLIGTVAGLVAAWKAPTE